MIEMRYIDIQIEKTLYVSKQLIDPNASPEHLKHHSIILRTLDPWLKPGISVANNQGG